ncbi:uncharacterized protein CELE_F01E11.20 [Caenorhabditis elegans]|uniref:Uncharacterized protein n=1 Tax=Caenorhabditis elegans TaxID=6239 RepID=A0A2K5AU01_CAEEL|nr:Uncharacterized protein CELE_F01E11.20 [Caenorhabditis elegans]SPC48662.1 Uncharacterized protein CELE_F01E11.20 [Caenorhabditis elegans]|eukprot:NP_001348801.1 Uncharacterized protein CELE_F01E11.20 [Caenorhabditis elegans]
MCLLIPVQI